MSGQPASARTDADEAGWADALDAALAGGGPAAEALLRALRSYRGVDQPPAQTVDQ